MDVPKVIAGSSDSPNLLLVTHGANATANRSSANPSEPTWVETLATTMAAYADSDWQVVTFDWKHFNGGSSDDEFITKDLPGLGDPFIAARNGINLGESLARWYEMNRTGEGFESVHLLGHSSGTWLVDAMADQLRKAGMADRIQLTTFDAFTPPGAILDASGERPAIGDSADFAVNYLHRYRALGLSDLVLFTDETLEFAINIDLSRIEQFVSPQTSHQFPYQWYTASAEIPDNALFAGYGARLSELYGGTFPQFAGPGGGPGRGDLLWLEVRKSADGIPFGVIYKTQAKASQVNLFESSNVTSGAVEVAPDGTATLMTTTPPPANLIQALVAGDDRPLLPNLDSQTPAVLNSLIEVETAFEAFQFNFTMDHPGLLSVYFEGEQLFGFDSTDLQLSLDEQISSGPIWLNEPFLPGTYALTFRVDALGDDEVTAELSNLEFIHFEVAAVPEPSTLLLASMAVLSLVFVTRKSGRRPGRSCQVSPATAGVDVDG